MRAKLQLQKSQRDRVCFECPRPMSEGSLYYRLIIFGNGVDQHDLCLKCGSMVLDLPSKAIESADTYDELMSEAEWNDKEMKRIAHVEAKWDAEREAL